MQSAETSDATAKGTLAPRSGIETMGVRLGGSSLANAGRRLLDASPVSLGVAATALVAAGVFTGYEMLRGASEAQALSKLLPGSDLSQFSDGVWTQGLVALALAVLVIALTYRRRGAERDGVSRRFVEEVLRTLPFGVALWSEDGRLTACNPSYLSQLRHGGFGVGATSYEAALRRLTEGGVVKIMGDGEQRR